VPPVLLHAGRSYRADAGLAARFGGFTGHVHLAGDSVAARASEKRALWDTTGAAAIDLESGTVAEIAAARSVPFAVVRAVCDPAQRDLPPAALLALNDAGAIGLSRVLSSVLRDVRQIPALLALGRDAAAARRSLIRVCRGAVLGPVQGAVATD
jgi:adenosylhomocysteine nucleosidase